MESDSDSDDEEWDNIDMSEEKESDIEIELNSLNSQSIEIIIPLKQKQKQKQLKKKDIILIHQASLVLLLAVSLQREMITNEVEFQAKVFSLLSDSINSSTVDSVSNLRDEERIIPLESDFETDLTHIKPDRKGLDKLLLRWKLFVPSPYSIDHFFDRTKVQAEMTLEESVLYFTALTRLLGFKTRYLSPNTDLFVPFCLVRCQNQQN